VEKSNGHIVKNMGIGKASGGATISDPQLSNSFSDIQRLTNWLFQSSRFDDVKTDSCLHALIH